MFTKNWYEVVAGSIAAQDVTCKGMTGSDISYPAGAGYALKLGYESTSDSGYYPMRKNVLTDLSTKYCGVVFGTGNTPPTLDDYKLGGDLITTISAAVVTTKSADETGCEVTTVYTLNNYGSAYITIGEVATVVTYAKAGEENKIMIERTVLDSPVTITAGGVGQVTYTTKLITPAA